MSMIQACGKGEEQRHNHRSFRLESRALEESVFFHALFLALLEVREADASHRSHRNAPRSRSFSSARNARAGGFGGGFRAVVFECCQRLMSPSRSFKRFSRISFVAASVDSFFLLLLSRLFSTLTMMIPRIQTLTMRSLSLPARVLLWSVVLVPGDANSVWNVSAQQYYQRETEISNRSNDNRDTVKSKFWICGGSLAHKQEHLWRKKSLTGKAHYTEPPDKRTGIGLILSSLRGVYLRRWCLEVSEVGDWWRINNYNLNVRV